MHLMECFFASFSFNILGVPFHVLFGFFAVESSTLGTRCIASGEAHFRDVTRAPRPTP